MNGRLDETEYVFFITEYQSFFVLIDMFVTKLFVTKLFVIVFLLIFV